MFVGMQATAPSRRHLRHWEQVCIFLDSQPYRAVTYPFPTEPSAPPMSVRLFKRMARFRLVRHRDDCRWQLSLRWRAILQQLADGMPSEHTENADRDGVRDPSDAGENDRPFIADTGVDTLYVNLRANELPAPLVEACAALKARAQDDDITVETPWMVLGAPLSIYKAGVGTSQKGQGVSWSFILRNAMVMVLLRKTPLAGLVGSVRLSAECLWTYGPREALTRLRRDVRRMWHLAAPGSFRSVSWQLSQIHLCADVANWAPEAADLDRVLTRSLKRSAHVPSTSEVEMALLLGDDSGSSGEDASWLLGMVPAEWEELPREWADGWYNGGWDGELGDDLDDRDDRDDRDDTSGGADREWSEWEPADEQGGATVHLWGQRASGFTFSPGADLSAVWYDKLLEERRSGKRWMRPIHEAGGWRLGMPLTRVEVRFRRGVLRELRAVAGRATVGSEMGATAAPQPTPTPTAPGGAPVRAGAGAGAGAGAEAGADVAGGAASAASAASEGGVWFDDPWRCLEHLGELWAYACGLPSEADTAPDVTYRGWMRLAVPPGTDSNRARWAVDPVWETVQRAQFTPTASVPRALVRRAHVVHDLEQCDAEVYGLLKLRAALRGEYLATTATLSQELRAFADRMDEEDAKRGRDFAEEVREKARRMGKPVPIRATGLKRVSI